MGLLYNIQAYLRDRQVKKYRLNSRFTELRRMNFAQAKNIGILFDATDLSRRNEALAYAKKIREQEKKVTLLGFFNSKQETADFPFNYFDRSGIDWAGRPKNKDVHFFLQSPYDIFIHLNPTPSEATEHIAALTEAHLKVGPASGRIDTYDLMVDVRDTSSLAGFIQQIEQLFQKTNLNHAAAKI